MYFARLVDKTADQVGSCTTTGLKMVMTQYQGISDMNSVCRRQTVGQFALKLVEAALFALIKRQEVACQIYLEKILLARLGIRKG